MRELKINLVQDLKNLNYEADKCLIFPTACVLAGQSIHPRHVAVRVPLQTSDDHPVRPSAVCLPLNDRNVECVCTEGRINFFHSVLYISVFSLSYLENHCNLSSSEIEDLDVFSVTI